MNKITEHVVRHLAKESREAHKAGDSKTASSLMLIGLGILLLPVPILGLPLIICGIIRGLR